MLADNSTASLSIGCFADDLHRPFAFLSRLIDFIADLLPTWRDDPQRPIETSETALTDQLCDFLEDAARHSRGWDILKFRTEVPDDAVRGRTIDLVAKPSGSAIWIDQRRYSTYETLIPIECKRLPTPSGHNRDEREYVYCEGSTTGGVQRFKCGYHGALHKLGAIIAFVQDDSIGTWNTRIGEWIRALADSGKPGWSLQDALALDRVDSIRRSATLHSSHSRGDALSPIVLRHLWIEI